MKSPKNPTAAKLRNQQIGTVAAPDRQAAEAEAVKAFGLDEDQRKPVDLGARMTAKKRRTKKPADRPRTFEQVRAANLADPFHAARIARLNMGERFDDATANSDDPLVCEVSVHPECEGGPHWIVEWGDRDGGCYVTTLDGPMAERRARDYFDALKAGRLKVLREIE
jgi:hypothetical protein